MRPSPVQPARETSPIWRALLLVTAVLLPALAITYAYHVWEALPVVRYGAHTREEYSAARGASNRKLTIAARDGMIAFNVSSLFTASYFDPAVQEHQADLIARMVAEMRATQLGRLQLAAFRMLAAERAGQPPEQWWPDLVTLLGGFSRVSYAHNLSDLIDARRVMFAQLGFTPGAAWEASCAEVRAPHGPFLQFVVDHLERIAAARRASDPESSLVCDRVIERLLRQWTLDSGPADVRVLAAELLADHLDAQIATASAPADTGEVVRALRACRAEYRAAVEQGTVPHEPFGIQSVPRPVAHEYATCIARTGWALRCAICLPVLVLVLVVASLIGTREVWRMRLSPAFWGCAALLAVAALVLPYFAPAAASDEPIRALQSSQLDTPWVLAIPAAVLLVLLIACSFLIRTQQRGAAARAATIALLAATTSVILGVVLLVSSGLSASALHDFDAAIAAESGPGAQIAINEQILAPVRAWEP